MGMIMYLSYGEGFYNDETIFSIMTALKYVASDANISILIYTDDPTKFEHLPVKIEKISEHDLMRWVGTYGYIHRRKTASIIEAIKKYQCPIAFIDSDTWFIQSPEKIFDRVKPGSTCLHLSEMRLLDAKTGVKRRFSTFLQASDIQDINGRKIKFSPNEESWNSGVVALHPEDIALMEEALHLTDEIWRDFKLMHDVEQFATGFIFGKNTKVNETKDIVYHYWPVHLRENFHVILPSIVRLIKELSLEKAIDLAYVQRPRNLGLRLAKNQLKDLLRSAHIKLPSPRTSG